MGFSCDLLRLGVLIAAVVVGGGHAIADDVSELVSRLGSPSRQDRQTSEEALMARGPAVLGILSRLVPASNGEARLRLVRVISRLEAVLTERSVEPFRLTLSVDGMPVRDLLGRIADESGNVIPMADEVASGEAGAKPVTVSVDRATYWEVVDEVLERGGLSLDCFGDGKGLRIVPARGGAPVRAASGPFLVIAGRVERGSATGASRPLRLGLRLVWEPRLEPLVLRLPMDSVQVEGTHGESIPPPSRRAVLETTLLPGSRWASLTLPLLASEPLPHRLGMVRGTVRLWLAAGEHDFEMTPGDAAAEPSLRVGQAVVSIRGFERDGRRWRVAAEVVYDEPSEPLASHRMWLTDRELLLVPAEGDAGKGAPAVVPLHPSEQSVVHRSDRGLAVTAEFLPPDGFPDAVRVRWRLPAAIREVPVDILLRDLPIP